MDKKSKMLITQIKKNPEEGICKVIDEYGASVKTICNHILRGCDQGLVEDVAQESFLRLWKNISEDVEVHKSLKSYLYQITRNCALDYLRKYQRQGCLSTDSLQYEGIEELATGMTANVEDEFARRYNYRLIHEVIDEMNEPDRTVFLLRYFYSYTVREIAEEIELKEDNVESRIRRGKKKLQNKLLERGVLYDAGS